MTKMESFAIIDINALIIILKLINLILTKILIVLKNILPKRI